MCRRSAPRSARDNTSIRDSYWLRISAHVNRRAALQWNRSSRYQPCAATRPVRRNSARRLPGVERLASWGKRSAISPLPRSFSASARNRSGMNRSIAIVRTEPSGTRCNFLKFARRRFDRFEAAKAVERLAPASPFPGGVAYLQGLGGSGPKGLRRFLRPLEDADADRILIEARKDYARLW